MLVSHQVWPRLSALVEARFSTRFTGIAGPCLGEVDPEAPGPGI